MWKNALKLFFKIFFPTHCVSCGSDNNNDFSPVICKRCFSSIPIFDALFCPHCKRRIPPDARLCHPQSRFLLGAVSSYHEKPLRELIHALKYDHLHSATPVFGKILAIYMQTISRAYSFNLNEFLIIPIPLFRKKERKRTYNQSLLIAQALCKVMDVSSEHIANNLLVRVKNTESQTKHKTRERREKNMHGAFVLRASEKIFEKNILLIDDVFTSGATMSEAARVLLEAKPKRILALVLAKA